MTTSPGVESRELPKSPAPPQRFRKSWQGSGSGHRRIVDTASPTGSTTASPTPMLNSTAPTLPAKMENVEEREDGATAIECLLFLKGKKIGEALGQTLVSAGADGKLRFWNVKDGSLCHMLKACHPKGSSISCMTSDEPSNKYLFTGCTSGHVKVWSLKSLEKAASKRIHRRFSVVGTDMVDAEHKQWARKASTEMEKRLSTSTILSPKSMSRRRSEVKTWAGGRRGSSMTLGPGATAFGRRKSSRRASLSESDFIMPKVYEIASWKAHGGALVSIEHVGEWGGREVVLTASTDCNVSVWTLKGAHIGIFGQTLNWSLTNPAMWIEKKEYVVEKPKGRYGRGGGVLDDGDSTKLLQGKAKGGGGEKKRMLKAKLAELDATMKQTSITENDDSSTSSSDGDLDNLDLDDEVDLFEEERKAYEKVSVGSVGSLGSGCLSCFIHSLLRSTNII